jgi:hypothetical protein
MSVSPDTVSGMTDQFLYRLSDADTALLYVGISDDWSRRIRQHALGKSWADDIANVRLERFPDRAAVLAAEAAVIRTEHPVHNIQHNGGHAVQFDVDLAPGRAWTAEDIILMVGLAVLAAYVIYRGTTIAVDKYRDWKAERAEFVAWKQARAEVPAHEPEPGAAGDPVPTAASVAEPVIVAEPELVTSPELVTVTEPPTAQIIIPRPATLQPLPVMTVNSPIAAVVICAAMLIQARKGNIDTALSQLVPTTRLFPINSALATV